jgi:hypothetical protein
MKLKITLIILFAFAFIINANAQFEYKIINDTREKSVLHNAYKGNIAFQIHFTKFLIYNTSFIN